MSDTVTCPHCLKPVLHWLPAMPLYTLQDAMVHLLMPSLGAMYTALWRHKDRLSPPQYAYDAHRKHRLLTARDIQTLRDCKKVSLHGVTRWMLHGS